MIYPPVGGGGGAVSSVAGRIGAIVLVEGDIANLTTDLTARIQRSILSVSTPTTAGSTAGTDYIYLVSGTTTITLPTAVGNSNRYTIKRTGTGVVTINTTSAQTIDGSASASLNVRYQSIDVISDGSNWNVI